MNIDSPFFSIIIPCYNQAEYMDETLQSVLDQTFPNWECIIVNDGSFDDTEKIALQWCGQDPRFIYINKKHTGVSDTRNFGIEKSKGNWILPLDSDDIIGSEYLRLSYNYIVLNQDIGIVYAKAAFFGEINYEWTLPEYNFEKLLISNHIYCSGIFNKEDWIRIGGYDINLKAGKEDWEFWINLLKYTNKNVYRLDYLGFFYRRKSLSRDKSLIQDKQCDKEIDFYIFSKHQELYQEQFNSPQQILLENEILKEEKQRKEDIENKINKNIITKFLYKIMKYLI